MTLAFRPRYGNGHATRLTFGHATRLAVGHAKSDRIQQKLSS
ncbi:MULTISPECIES: hypothetical protein [unclassified Moorena]|nr:MULTISPECIES: hypothetical protein [unclassified Moorena]